MQGPRKWAVVLDFQTPPSLIYGEVHTTCFSLFSWPQWQQPQPPKPWLWNWGSQPRFHLSVGLLSPRGLARELLPARPPLLLSSELDTSCGFLEFVLSSIVRSLYYNLTSLVMYYLPRVRFSWDRAVSYSSILSFVTVPRWSQAQSKPIIPIFWFLSWLL